LSLNKKYKEGGVASMDSYKSKSIEVIIELYESGIEALEGAERAFFSHHLGSAETFYRHLNHCQGVVHQLIRSLDFSRQSETAAQLFQMYDHINYQITRANILKEVQSVRWARELFQQLKQRVESELGGELPKPSQMALSRSSN
jgi:flagellin-specific chaperone FliS